MVNWLSAMVPKPVNGERISLSNKWGSARYPNTKVWIWTPISHHIQKLTQQRLEIQKVKKTVKCLVENTSVHFHELGLGNGFLDMTLKA